MPRKPRKASRYGGALNNAKRKATGKVTKYIERVANKVLDVDRNPILDLFERVVTMKSPYYYVAQEVLKYL